ncbi:MAG: calcium-binding protein [Rhizobiales bacterium]|nr:calcium-binding protein [Hyphomicrobiales bacterium]
MAGNAGNNFIDGKSGRDTLSGNGGSDQFLFTTTLSAATNIDYITDFDVTNDFLRLDDAVFAVLSLGYLSAAAFRIGAAATDATDRIVYNSATGAVYFDADGAGIIAQVQFAKLSPGLALTNADIYVF